MVGYILYDESIRRHEATQTLLLHLEFCDVDVVRNRNLVWIPYPSKHVDHSVHSLDDDMHISLSPFVCHMDLLSETPFQKSINKNILEVSEDVFV